MMKFLLGQKLGMSQVFDEKGKRIPVTLVEAGPCVITQVKTKEKDGYQAIQLGFKKIEKEKKIKKPMRKKPFRWLREFKGEESKLSSSPVATAREDGEYKVGDQIDVSVFQEGKKVKVSGISKGKGFQGAVKRWGFKGRASATHGTKHEHRTLGSIGSSFPEKVIKGKKMPGRMGSERTTVKNLEIVKIDKENNLLAVKGAVPGVKGTLLEIIG
ncbi:MAG: 50S ribosomal protein L3 [Candidatus Nealsonbacteria bacterium]|nr:50S ribosomal protein L3 [Candidatus Nealsonbacteria bacterium]